MTLRMYTMALAVGALTLTGITRAEEPAKTSRRIEIPFANLGGIEDWRPDGDRTLYVQGRNRQWYKAELMTSCIGLNFAEHIGFVVEPSGAFDRFSAILVDHRECQISSLEKSDKPPSKKDKAAKKQ